MALELANTVADAMNELTDLKLTHPMNINLINKLTRTINWGVDPKDKPKGYQLLVNHRYINTLK